MSEATRPSRRFGLEILISGDSWDDVLVEVERLAEHIREHGPDCKQVSGGYSTGSHITITEHPDMTHDRYVAELDAYLAATKEAP